MNSRSVVSDASADSTCTCRVSDCRSRARATSARTVSAPADLGAKWKAPSLTDSTAASTSGSAPVTITSVSSKFSRAMRSVSNAEMPGCARSTSSTSTSSRVNMLSAVSPLAARSTRHCVRSASPSASRHASS